MPNDPIKEVSQEIITPPSFSIPPNRRITQKDLQPLATKFRLTEFYDPSDNTLKFKDGSGNTILLVNLNTGAITFNYSVTLAGTNSISGNTTFTGTVTNGVAVSSFVKELQIMLLSGGATGGASDTYYTDATTFQNLNASEFNIDPDNYPGASFYLEAVCRAGANGDTLRTFSMDLYDVTGAAAITNSQIDTTSTEGAAGAGSLIRLRGTTNFRTNLTSGSREYTLRYKSDTATRFVDLYEARLIIQY